MNAPKDVQKPEFKNLKAECSVPVDHTFCDRVGQLEIKHASSQAVFNSEYQSIW